MIQQIAANPQRVFGQITPSQLLEKKPGDYGTLGKYLHLLKRTGRLREYEKCLQNAERHSERAAEMDPGFRFCRGVYSRYVNRPAQALIDLNFARTRDADLRVDATMAMVDIYLYPDPSKVGLESLQDPSNVEHSDHHCREVELLIQELLTGGSAAKLGPHR